MKIHSRSLVLLLASITVLAGVRYGGARGETAQREGVSPAAPTVTFYYTIRASVASDGEQSDGWSDWPAISADGRYVAFYSEADNLAPDTYPYSAIYVHDTLTRETVQVSVITDGVMTQYYASTPDISAEGRYIVYYGTADGVVDGKPVFVQGIYVHDRLVGVTTMVSVAPDGSPADGHASWPAISGDGRFVAFSSRATNLLKEQPEDDCHEFCDRIYVHDRETGLNTLVSVSSNGTPANDWSDFPDISADGRFVVFSSYASNLVAGDENDEVDVFLHDGLTGQTTRVSVASDGTEANGASGLGSISADGRYVAFNSRADNLAAGDTNDDADVFVHDRLTGETTHVSVASDGSGANDWAGASSISADGRVVAFASSASNLVAGDTNGTGDIFIHDRETGQTKRVSMATDGRESNDSSDRLALSGDGASVAYYSYATNLVEGDTNMCPEPPYEHLPGECPDIFFYRSYDPPLTEMMFLPLIR